MSIAMVEAVRVLQLQRLLQLASPSLPVGAFAYSEGLETAVHNGTLADAGSVRSWLDGTLCWGFGALDLPVFYRLQSAWAADDEAVLAWSDTLMASRETSERRAQERHLGTALAALLYGLGVARADDWRRAGTHADRATFACLFALAAGEWQIGADDAAAAFAWAWLENQVLAAVKLVPLGQTDGQRLLLALAERVPDVLARAAALDDDDIGGALPGATLMSIGHETLYSRLFRS